MDLEGVGAYEQVTRQKVEALEERFEVHERRQNGSLERIDKKLAGLATAIGDLRVTLAARPTWLFTGVVSLLTALVAWFLKG